MTACRRSFALSLAVLLSSLTACNRDATPAPQTESPPPAAADTSPAADAAPPEGVAPAPTPDDLSKKLRVEVVSVKPLTSSGEKVRVAYRATNIAQGVIVRAKATIVVFDAGGSELGRETHWIVRSDVGGLNPGAAVEEDFIISVTDKQKAAQARFDLEIVRGG